MRIKSKRKANKFEREETKVAFREQNYSLKDFYARGC